jgi:hypothetical protein
MNNDGHILNIYNSVLKLSLFSAVSLKAAEYKSSCLMIKNEVAQLLLHLIV